MIKKLIEKFKKTSKRNKIILIIILVGVIYTISKIGGDSEESISYKTEKVGGR